MRRLVPLVLLLTACRSPSGTVVTPEQLRAMDQAAARQQQQLQPGGPAPVAPAAPGVAANPFASRAGLSDDQAKKRDDLDQRRTALSRRKEDQTRDAYELDQKRKRLELDQQAAAAQEAVTLETADREHRLAAEDLARFREKDKPHRLASDALDVQVSQDGLLEAEEELTQLKMMYSDSQLGDATAEIVLNRSKRRLERAQERNRLRLEDSDQLKNVQLPRDEDALVQAEHAKAVALENAHRAADKAKLERDAALRDLDFESRKLEREAADVARDQAILDRDVSSWSRELSGSGTP